MERDRYRKSKSTHDSESGVLWKSHWNTNEEVVAFELGKEVEPKRRSPNIIAKFMGLEGLSSPSHVHRQQKQLSENHQPKNHSIKAQRNTLLYDGLSISKSPMEQVEFKDVYEDLEASHVVNQRRSSRWSTSSTLVIPEKVPIQQTFVDAKHLSADDERDGWNLRFARFQQGHVTEISRETRFFSCEEFA